MDDEDRYTRITLRIPKKLHAELSVAADRKSMSLNAEIVNRLEGSFARSADPSELAQQIEGLSKQLMDAAAGRFEEIDRRQRRIETLRVRKDSLYNRLLLLENQRLNSAAYRRMLREKGAKEEATPEYREEIRRAGDIHAGMINAKDEMIGIDTEIEELQLQIKVLRGDDTPLPEPDPSTFAYLNLQPVKGEVAADASSGASEPATANPQAVSRKRKRG